MKEEGCGIQTAVTSERASGSSRALLAQTAAVIVRPEREHLPGAVRRWPRHRSTSWSPAASILAKTSLSTDSEKALQRSLRAWCGGKMDALAPPPLPPPTPPSLPTWVLTSPFDSGSLFLIFTPVSG